MRSCQVGLSVHLFKMNQELKMTFMVKVIHFIDQDLYDLNNPTLTAKQQILSLHYESISCSVENVIDNI